MQTNIYVSSSTSELRVRLAQCENDLSPPVIFFTDHSNVIFFVDHLHYFCLFLLFFRACLFIDALWSPAWKGLTSWLSLLMSNCEVVTFLLVSWVRCGA